MKDENAILYVQTSNDPARQYSPLVLAQSAKAMDLKPTVYYLGMGLLILRPGEAEKIQLGSFPSVREMLDKTMAMGIPILVCEASKQMLGWDKRRAHRGCEDRGRGDPERSRARCRRDHVVLGGPYRGAPTGTMRCTWTISRPDRSTPGSSRPCCPTSRNASATQPPCTPAGDRATAALEESRAAVADFLGAAPDEIVFTSGATESNNLALIGYASRNKRSGDHVVISEVEHISLHNIGKYLEKEGFRVTKVPPDQFGRINPDKLRSRITDDTILVSVGWASNEIGTVQPIPAIAEMLNGTGVALHVDAVAAEGQLPIDMATVPVDLLTISSNDIYGPPGLGALYVRNGVRLAPVTMGGGQERGLRSGTENMPAIVGMAAAARIAAEELATEAPRLAAMRDRLIKRGALHHTRLPPERPSDQTACPTTPTSASKASKANPLSCP